MKNTARGSTIRQEGVLTPSFCRGVASIVDVPGKLAVFKTGRPRLLKRNQYLGIRSDRQRIARDFAIVAPPQITQERVEQIIEAASK